MKKLNYLFLSPLVILSVVGCQDTNKDDKEYTPDTDPTYYSKIEERNSLDSSNETNINESFTNGISDDKFYAIDGVWDAGSTQPHNGVRSRNLFYTIDENNNKLLAIKGRGRYNEEGASTKNKPEGAVLITKDHLGPGRFEITMASFPRFGGCSAFWTYCSTTGNEATSQNEIDIEIGGGGQYTNEWCTTWTTHTTKETKNMSLENQLHFNDGKMHKYTFDWYTDYEDTGERRIDWFVDEVFVTSITGAAVPEHQMPLWIGLWLPSWAGDSLFDTDYMLIKNISYTAFDDNQYSENCRSYTQYTKSVPSSLGIQTIDYSEIKNINKFSNGDFKKTSVYSGEDYYGWKVDTSSKGTFKFSNEGSTSSSNAIELTALSGSTSKYHGEYINQTVGGAYEGYQYELSIDAKLKDTSSVGNIEIYYKDGGNITLSKEIISVNTLDYASYTKTLTMPKGAVNLRIDITSEDGTVSYSNASLVFKGTTN